MTTRRLPFSEPSATIVWGALYKLNLAHRTVLWNALQLHPHRPGEPWTNRTPTPREIAQGQAARRMLREHFPKALFVAVGKKAEGLLAEVGIACAAAIRHPAKGRHTVRRGTDQSRPRIVLKPRFRRLDQPLSSRHRQRHTLGPPKNGLPSGRGVHRTGMS